MESTLKSWQLRLAKPHHNRPQGEEGVNHGSVLTTIWRRNTLLRYVSLVQIVRHFLSFSLASRRMDQGVRPAVSIWYVTSLLRQPGLWTPIDNPT